MSIDFKKNNRYNPEIHQRAKSCIAQGALTNSKRPESFIEGIYPTHLIKGHGCTVVDVNGNSYIDFICGLGTNLIGYDNLPMRHALRNAHYYGTSLSLPTLHEVKYAEDLKAHFHFVDRWKFLKTGTEACMAAVRMARAFTKRQLVLSEGYHGHADLFQSLNPPHNGVSIDQNIMKLEKHEMGIDLAAAVIIEPVMLDDSVSRRQYVEQLRKDCDKHGTILIFDEIITGFRFPKLSVANYWDIKPDLICLGKAMAGGMPLAAVGGRKEIMDGDYFVSSTYAGDIVSITAGHATLTAVAKNYPIKTLWEFGEEATTELNELCKGVVQFKGYATRGVLDGDELMKALFMQESVKAGLLFGPSYFFCHSHIDVWDQVKVLLRDVILKVKNPSTKLEGNLPVKPYAQKVRG